MVEYRQPAACEVEDLARLDHEIFGKRSYNLMSMRQFYDLAGPLLIVAVDGPLLVGYALILPSFVNDEGWFMALGVQADYRRSGIGDALASRAVSDAEKVRI